MDIAIVDGRVDTVDFVSNEIAFFRILFIFLHFFCCLSFFFFFFNFFFIVKRYAYFMDTAIIDGRVDTVDFVWNGDGTITAKIPHFNDYVGV